MTDDKKRKERRTGGRTDGRSVMSHYYDYFECVEVTSA